jgi:hypothetical protein
LKGSLTQQPKDEQNPLNGNAYHDDLILWLADKEAKAIRCGYVKGG